ncbi:GspE/PulE family protein [Candidatus Parcubacteria bacterium]|nr:GspE/PulE family protein [Candidatus Parcubacteria bacterium]
MDLLPYLTKNGVLTKEKGNEILKSWQKSGGSQERFLLKEKILPEGDLFRYKGEALGLPLKKLKPEEIAPEIFALIPKESVEYYKITALGIDKDQKILEVGMVYPENTQAQEALKFLSRQQKVALKIYLISFSDFDAYIKQYRAPEKEVEKALEKLEEEIEIEKEAGKKAVSSEKFSRVIEEAPIIKMTAVILRQAVEGKASDIHIEPTTDDLRVRYRLDGVLYTSLVLPLKVHSAIVARIKILSRLKIDETRVPQDGRFSTNMASRRIDFRVSTFPTMFGEKVVIRVLDPSEGLLTLTDLGLSGNNLAAVKRAIVKPDGMILVTGPTGSGKTTTLYTVLRILNKEEVNIVTLEDPVEYFMAGVNQSQVRPEIDYTFARGLRQILRQDPDIIMVGEIRDEETASLAVQAALTGHLVLSTLHTTSAVGVIPRLLDMDIKPFLLSPTLNVALSQRLIRILCPICKKRVALEGEAKKYVLERLKEMPKAETKKWQGKNELFAYEPKGCKKCNFRGYSGRKGIFEVVEMSDKLAEIILSGSFSERAMLNEAKNQGMITMEQDGILKVLEGITSLEEVISSAQT